MDKYIKETLAGIEKDLVNFARDLIRIKSYSGREEEAVRFTAKKMEKLDYDEITIDAMGNVTGRIGSGEKKIMLDSHLDTVAVKDDENWDYPPFSGEIVDGKLYGRGAVDMKSAAASSIYAGYLAKQLGLEAGKTIYVSGTVMEEDCDGENLKHLFNELAIRPDFFVTCEPSDNRIVTGHKGKAQITIKTTGKSAHGSAPEKGQNAIYEMAEIIQRVEKTNQALLEKEGPKSTLVMSKISSKSVSLNAVPYECEAYLDRRTVTGETEALIKSEVEQILAGKTASWEIDTLHRKSWTGLDISYKPFHPAWEINLEQHLAQTCTAAYQEFFGEDPEYDYWDFSTNAVTPVSMGIPTIGFGPGVYKLAHCTNENCAVDKIIEACGFYAALIGRI